MFKVSPNKIALAASALLLCAGLAQATTPPGSPLTAAPASVSISFALPSTPGMEEAVAFTVPTADVSDPFVIDPTTVPFWLSILNAGGSATDLSDTAVPSPGVTLNFVGSAAAGTLGVGAYTASVHVKVNGFQDLVVPVTLTVTSATPATLSVTNAGTAVSNGGTVPLTWVYGAALPTVSLTLLSSDYPISFTAASAVAGGSPEDWIQLSAASGIAYNYGTPINITFASDALLNSRVSVTPITGTVTISYASTTYVIHIAITVTEPNPTISNIFPQETPVVASGALTVVVTGTGFGTTAQGFTTATTVKIAYGAVTATALTGITASGGGPTGTVTVVNPTTMVLSIPWQDATPVSILDTPGQNVTISITNAGTTVTALLYVTANPVIYSISDAAALAEPTPGGKPNVAPYELITIFGNNFCPTCVAPVVAPISSSRYPTTLTAPVTSGHPLTVTFYKSDGTTLVGDAFILFANNTQINALVPSTVLAADNPMQVVVSYNSVLSNTNVLYEVNAVAANPGIFTTTSNGQGQGAILLSDFSVNSAANPAIIGDKVAGTALIYASGLGVPNSTSASVTSTKAGTFPTSCFSVAGYVTAAGLTSPATADGAVLLASDWGTGNLPPCFSTKSYVTVTIGGVAATVTYDGWVAGSVTGLYQINVTVPKATTSLTPVNLPVVVTVNGVQAQTGVTMSVKN